MVTIKTAEQQQKQANDLVRLARKIQVLIKSGATFIDKYDNLITNAHQVAQKVQDGETCTLYINTDCLVLSPTAANMLKNSIKNLIDIEVNIEKQKMHFVCFKCKDDLAGQLAQINTETTGMEFCPDGVNIPISIYQVPKYHKALTIHTLETPPNLPQKVLDDILDVARQLNESQDFYVLLSDDINIEYNMPLNILSVLGANVLSLNALNLLEVLLVYATNSSAVTKAKAEKELKQFRIPFEFINNPDFDLLQSRDEITDSLEQLMEYSLIDDYIVNDDDIIINSHLIVNNIKQYSYTQEVGFYTRLDLQQEGYIYTFINYLNWITHIDFITVDEETGKKKKHKATELTISLSDLLFNLDMKRIKSDHKEVARRLTNCRKAAIKAHLLQSTGTPITADVVKHQLSHRHAINEIFRLNTAPVKQVGLMRDIVASLNEPPSQGRTYLNR